MSSRVPSANGAAGVLPLVPLLGAYRGEELLHRRLVAAEELAVEVARIPLEEHAADIEDGDAAPPVAGHHLGNMNCTCARSCQLAALSGRATL